MKQFKVIREYDALVSVSNYQFVNAMTESEAIEIAKEIGQWDEPELIGDLEDYDPYFANSIEYVAETW